jgi:hypothetical protein
VGRKEIVMHRATSALAAMVVVAGLAGCHHEVVHVPPRSSMRRQISVHEMYAVSRDTELAPLFNSTPQPTIDEFYGFGQIPPAEAFAREPFRADAPFADSITVVHKSLSAGTAIDVSVVDVYDTCHVYFGQVASGRLRNIYLQFVVPRADGSIASMADLNLSDAAYLSLIAAPSTKPATSSKADK